jgi:hypothetical protein
VLALKSRLAQSCAKAGTGGGLVNGRNTERSLALAGVVFVVLVLISAFLPGSPPKPDDSAAKIAKFVVDNNDQLRWAGFVGLLAAIVLLGWLGAVWRTMRRAEGGTPMLAVGAALGAGLAAALFSVGGILMSAVAIVGPAQLGNPDTRFFYILFNALGSAGAIGLALFIGAFASVILETGVLPKVMGWLGVLVALALLVAGGGVASTRDVFFVFGFIGFISFAIWTLVISVLMFRADARPSAAASAS